MWVAGHKGLLGSALTTRLASEDCELLSVGRQCVDLRRQADVEDWIAEYRPQAVFLAAATVGGIRSNDSRPAEFIYDNLAIETNILHGAWKAGVEKLLFLGSSCSYPRNAPQPIREEALLSGPPETTNQWYAVAKIAGIKMCQAYRRQYGCDFITGQPANLYGPGDNFDLSSSHVIPALIAKTHQAKVEGSPDVEVWGSGSSKREFIYVEDLADALVFLIKSFSDDVPINVGVGRDLTIRELAKTVLKVVDFGGQLRFNSAMPDGTPRKLLDTARLRAMGWTARTGLREGLRRTYDWYLDKLNAGV